MATMTTMAVATTAGGSWAAGGGDDETRLALCLLQIATAGGAHCHAANLIGGIADLDQM